jgi:Domain of unknown function (DUF4193)
MPNGAPRCGASAAEHSGSFAGPAVTGVTARWWGTANGRAYDPGPRERRYEDEMAEELTPQENTEFEEPEEELDEADIDPDIDPDELDEEELVDDEEGAFVELEPDDDLEVIEDEAEVEAEEAPVRRAAGEEEDDDEDLVDPDDVEADLDTILKDRLVAASDEPEEDDEEVEVDDRGDPVDRILPKRPGEFVCQSCFLVKHPSQLADVKRQLCADCV